MAAKMMLICLTLAVILSSVSATPLERKRRFLLDITDGVKDVQPHGNKKFPFSWEFYDGEFTIQDKAGVLKAISQAENKTKELLTFGLFFYNDAKEFRRHELRYPGDKYMDMWMAAANTMTNLLDTTNILRDVMQHYNAELVGAINNGTEPDGLRDLFDGALNNIGFGIVRVENQLSEGWPVLTTLRDSATNIDTDKVNLFLAGFIRLENLMSVIKICYQRLIDAADIDPDN